MASALGHVRICDLSGQLAGAGATRTLAAFGAEVIRVEDPVRQGRWDVLRGQPPFVDERRGLELGGSFNNHNVGKLGVTIDLRADDGRVLFERLVAVSDVVVENFAAGVLARLGYPYERLRALRSDVIYVSSCGFGHSGPYERFKTWGPVVQAIGGLTYLTGSDGEPSGIGYSYMDHQGANMACIAILAALHHRSRTGKGCWIDLATTEAAAALAGPDVLDATVNGRPVRRPGRPDSNRDAYAGMAPHGIYPSAGEDRWIALCCRDDDDWAALVGVIGERWAGDGRWAVAAGRRAAMDQLDELVARWTAGIDRDALVTRLWDAGVPAAPVREPRERIDEDPTTTEWGLWPTVEHPEIGPMRVEGIPLHLSRTDWRMARGAPCLGEHNVEVFGDLLGLSGEELARLQAAGVI